mgnify:CR=1 FL=1
MMSIVDHIAILVDDLNTAEEWYTEKLDGKVTFRDEKYIRMSVSNTNIALICYSDEQKKVFLSD